MNRSFSTTGGIINGYLQKTRIPTYHFQNSLLRLPIPKFEDTMKRYAAAVEPVVTNEQFKETKEAIAKFEAKEGPELHQQLVLRDKENSHTSFINEWWFEKYVMDRDPLLITTNPQIRLRDDPVVEKNTQSQRASSLIASAVRFYRTLRDGHLKPDLFHTKPHLTKDKPWFDTLCALTPSSVSLYPSAALGAYPLDMSQYKNLFQSTRLPQKGSDRLEVYPDSKHIVIQYGKDFYTLQVLRNDGTAVPDEEILAGIENILNTPVDATGTGIGVLSTLNRDVWADARTELVQASPVNKSSLEAIDSALFAVCLEHTSPESHEDLSRCFLTGNGSNHWFDKSFQLIIAANGKAALNFEHAWGDGVAVLRFMNETYEDSIKYPVLRSTAGPAPEKLEFQVPSSVEETIQDGMTKFREWNDRLLISVAEADISRDIGKKYSIGMDGILQMTIQLAHFRLHNSFVSTYESASTSAYRHGRTETIRSCTNDAVAFCRTMCDKAASRQDKEAALRKAVKTHGELTKNGLMGQGCDRHLFALKQLASLNGQPMPELFTIPSAEIMNKIILSTSTLSSPNLEGGSFGPVNDDCYAVGYGVEDLTMFQLAAYRNDLSDLSQLLYKSLHDICNTLTVPPKKN